MKSLFIKILLLSIGIIYIAQADSLIRIKCDDQDIGTKVYFNNKLAGECPFDKFIPEGKISIRAHKVVNSDYEQFFNKEIYATEGGIQKVELGMSPAQLTPDAKRRQEEAQAKQKVLDEQLREQQRIKQLKAENAKGVWIDKERSIMWQDDVDAKIVEKDQQEAINYCQNLTLADYDDWRLPDKDTLVNLLVKKRTSLNNVSNGFLGSKYWSSSIWDTQGIPSTAGYYVAVDFGFGTTGYQPNHKTSVNHVRCVRDNKY